MERNRDQHVAGCFDDIGKVQVVRSGFLGAISRFAFFVGRLGIDKVKENPFRAGGLDFAKHSFHARARDWKSNHRNTVVIEIQIHDLGCGGRTEMLAVRQPKVIQTVFQLPKLVRPIQNHRQQRQRKTDRDDL